MNTSNLSLADLNRILDALVEAHDKATNEDKPLHLFTIKRVAELRAEQIQWLYEEYSA
jgi:hypothetical protein